MAVAMVDVPDDLITDDEVQKITKLPRGTLKWLRSRGKIPYYKLGGGRIIRYRRSEIERWILAAAAGGSR